MNYLVQHKDEFLCSTEHAAAHLITWDKSVHNAKVFKSLEEAQKYAFIPYEPITIHCISKLARLTAAYESLEFNSLLEILQDAPIISDSSAAAPAIAICRVPTDRYTSSETELLRIPFNILRTI